MPNNQEKLIKLSRLPHKNRKYQ